MTKYPREAGKYKSRHISKDGHFHYTQCGLDNVYLVNGFSIEETPYGVTYAIKDADALHRTIADAVVTNPKTIRGQEIRFLRSVLQLSQSMLAESLGLSRPTIARYERKASIDVPLHVDKALRNFYGVCSSDHPESQELLALLREIDDLSDLHNLTFEQSGKGDHWRPKAA